MTFCLFGNYIAKTPCYTTPYNAWGLLTWDVIDVRVISHDLVHDSSGRDLSDSLSRVTLPPMRGEAEKRGSGT